MAMAICFKCGSAKSGALVACRSCNAAPHANIEYAVSLALSDHLSSKDQLAQYSHELLNGKKLSMSREALVQALDALKDPQLLAMLKPAPPAPASSAPAATRQHPPAPPAASQRAAPPPPPVKQGPRLTTTALHHSAFAVLGVTTRDNRRRILELAEEKSLELDHDVCQKARSDLTNPRIRLGAEIAWLPGVSPRKATQLIENLLNDPMAIRDESGLPTLAHLNLLAAVFEVVNGKHDADDLARFIMDTAYLAEELIPEEVLRDINEDRAVSAFPEVRTLDQIEAELGERKRYYRSVIKDSLDKLPSLTLIQIMTQLVESVTSGGEDHAPELIDDLVDSYEVEVHGVLEKEAENAHELIKAIKQNISSGEEAITPFVNRLETVARNWDKIAQPIQLSAKARGIDHAASDDLAWSIRDLAIELFNKHDMLGISKRLTGLIQELFSELPEIVDRVEADSDALADIEQQRQEAAERRENWAREITYFVEIGTFFRKALSISPEGIRWKSQKFALESITCVRWGGTRTQYGTHYIIAFGDENSEAVVELRDTNIYQTFTEKLWRAVCGRLLIEMLQTLREGHDLYFGDAILHDDGVTLQKPNFIGAHESVRCTWNQVTVSSDNGVFWIRSKKQRSLHASTSYVNGDNTHIIEHAIRKAFNHPGMTRLSDIIV